LGAARNCSAFNRNPIGPLPALTRGMMLWSVAATLMGAIVSWRGRVRNAAAAALAVAAAFALLLAAMHARWRHRARREFDAAVQRAMVSSLLPSAEVVVLAGRSGRLRRAA
jgi:hypothetical protein